MDQSHAILMTKIYLDIQNRVKLISLASTLNIVPRDADEMTSSALPPLDVSLNQSRRNLTGARRRSFRRVQNRHNRFVQARRHSHKRPHRSSRLSEFQRRRLERLYGPVVSGERQGRPSLREVSPPNPLGQQYVDLRRQSAIDLDLKGGRKIQMLPDGNCGFRAIAWHLHRSCELFYQVRDELLQQFQAHSVKYLAAIRIDKPDITFSMVKGSLDIPHGQRGSSGLSVVRKDRWLSSTVHFQILADTYRLIVISIAGRGGAISITAPTEMTKSHQDPNAAVRRRITSGRCEDLLCLLYTETIEGGSGHFDYLEMESAKESGRELREWIAEKGCFTPSAVDLSRSGLEIL